MKKILSGEQLIQRAKELGVDIQGDIITASIAGRHKIADEFEIQRRVIEAERSIREASVWKIAFVSAIASVISAAAAWFAVWTP